MYINNLTITFIVFSSFGLIRMHAKIHWVFNLTILLGVVEGFSFLMLSYMKLGEVNERSKKFHVLWKRKSGYLNPVMNIKMKKFIKSSRPLRIELGQFGFYSKAASIRLFGKLVTYVVRFLMLTAKYGA